MFGTISLFIMHKLLQVTTTAPQVPGQIRDGLQILKKKKIKLLLKILNLR